MVRLSQADANEVRISNAASTTLISNLLKITFLQYRRFFSSFRLHTDS